MVEHGVHRAGLDDLALVQHVDAVDQLPDDGQVVRDEEVRDPELVAQRAAAG